MNAIGYLRASTSQQDLSPEAQRASILVYAKAKGLEVLSWHADLGVSGTTPVPDRPGLLAALDALKAAGKGSVLVVAKRDRLARSVLVAATAEALAKRVGCSIVSADGAGAGDGPEAELMRNLLDSFAQFERSIIAARTRSALAVKRSRGERVTRHAPLGFRHEAGMVVVDAAEQAMLAEARELAPGRSASQVAALLAAKGYRNRRGKPVGKGNVLAMLRVPEVAVSA